MVEFFNRSLKIWHTPESTDYVQEIRKLLSPFWGFTFKSKGLFELNFPVVKMVEVTWMTIWALASMQIYRWLEWLQWMIYWWLNDCSSLRYWRLQWVTGYCSLTSGFLHISDVTDESTIVWKSPDDILTRFSACRSHLRYRGFSTLLRPVQASCSQATVLPLRHVITLSALPVSAADYTHYTPVTVITCILGNRP